MRPYDSDRMKIFQSQSNDRIRGHPVPGQLTMCLWSSSVSSSEWSEVLLSPGVVAASLAHTLFMDGEDFSASQLQLLFSCSEQPGVNHQQQWNKSLL